MQNRPCSDRVLASLSLNVHTINVKSDHIYTKLGVPVTVVGIAQVGILECCIVF